MLKWAFIAFVLGFSFSSAYASGNKHNMDWPNPQEKLVYYSCGCADSCWVADLQDKVKNTSKIELWCDCETMHLKIKGVEKPYDGECKSFENEDKFDRITAEIAKIQALNKSKNKK
ncbi:MAG: hypothetical protein A3J37_02330 [Alphaproteobacteria bacterium RIFCSPHIGHO2_12_FULL_45_9]|nr:MAG: hypothetical protein A3B66_02625 [Alphaproteobacteria bacterium RIFCSPHIGHO2_02_FULL_46_13]OFW96735.1 MAG: hypothetical protein A3J37_02330 [Alphaproteobacteria bacterium RIFCSPHIGHO2_12_FULL_45_9]